MFPCQTCLNLYILTENLETLFSTSTKLKIGLRSSIEWHRLQNVKVVPKRSGPEYYIRSIVDYPPQMDSKAVIYTYSKLKYYNLFSLGEKECILLLVYVAAFRTQSRPRHFLESWGVPMCSTGIRRGESRIGWPRGSPVRRHRSGNSEARSSGLRDGRQWSRTALYAPLSLAHARYRPRLYCTPPPRRPSADGTSTGWSKSDDRCRRVFLPWSAARVHGHGHPRSGGLPFSGSGRCHYWGVLID